MMKRKSYTTIDQYIADFEEPVKSRLETMRRVIREEAPQAIEAISYMMPTFKLNGNLVHFAGFKNHIGFYPIPSGIAAFTDDLAPYATTKGGVQFPHDHPLPTELVRKIVRYRVTENLRKQK